MTETSRREFIQYLACVAAASSPLPATAEAFAQYYEANTPHVDRLVAVDEIFLSGTASRGFPLIFDLFKNDKMVVPYAINLFGGIMRIYFGPDQKIVAGESDIFWQMRRIGGLEFDDDEFSFSHVVGHVTYIGMDKVRRYAQFTKPQGSIIDP